jgi:hypothetical protein
VTTLRQAAMKSAPLPLVLRAVSGSWLKVK